MIKFNFLVLSIYFLFGINPANAVDKSWGKVSDGEDYKVWLLKKNSDITGAIEVSKTQDSINWEQVNKEELLKKYKNNKINALSVIGISEWKVESYEWKVVESKHHLLVTGSYINHSQQKISFRELQIFNSNQTVQILSTWPSEVLTGNEISQDFVEKATKSQI